MYFKALLAVLFLVAGFSVSQADGRSTYLEACTKATGHFKRMTKGRLTSEEFCPCMYDNTMTKVEPDYSQFAVKLLHLSVLIVPLSPEGFSAYVTRMNRLVASRPDGEQARLHVSGALRQAQHICMKRS